MSVHNGTSSLTVSLEEPQGVLVSLVEEALQLCPRLWHQCSGEFGGVRNTHLDWLVYDVDQERAGGLALRADVTAPAEGRDGDHLRITGEGDVAGKAAIETPL